MSRINFGSLLAEEYERLKSQVAGDSGQTAPQQQANDQQTVAESNTETVDPQQVEIEPPKQSAILESLKKHGVSLGDGVSDDEAAAKQLAEIVADKRRRDEEFVRLQREREEALTAARQAELRALSQQQQQPVQQPTTPQQTPAAELKKWGKVELDPNLARICRYDENALRFVPNPEYGIESQQAASKLNEAATEQRRRQDLILNDPMAAMQEAGLDQFLESKINERFGQLESSIRETITKRSQEAVQAKAQQVLEDRSEKFYQSHESEFFEKNPDGKLVVNVVDGNFVFTPRGKLFSEKCQQLVAQYGNTLSQVDIAELAYQMLPPVQQVEAPKADPKKKFVDEARGSGTAPSRKMEPSEVQAALTTPKPVLQGAGRFADMFRDDPAHQELLQRHYAQKP